MRIAALRAHRWAEVSVYFLPCLPLVLSAHLAGEFAESTAPTHHRSGRPIKDDLTLFDLIDRTGTPVYVHTPSLVEHAELPSVAGNRTGRRLASCFATDPRTLGIGKGVCEGLPVVPHFSWS